MTVNAIQTQLTAIKLTERGAETATKLLIRVKPADPASKQYYDEQFKPRLLELLQQESS